jgi:uncharacterized protein YndB with AHSA1/START domain
MNFFPDVPPLPDPDDEGLPAPAWTGASPHVIPGVVPVAAVIGRSADTAVMLTALQAFPTGLAMRLGVRVRGPVGPFDLTSEICDGPPPRDKDAGWAAGRLKWGFELTDGTRVTNLDRHPWPPEDRRADPTWEPDRPVLSSTGGHGGRRSVDYDYWLWPLPPEGTLRVACEWLHRGVAMTVQDLPAGLIRDAAALARPLWPSDAAGDPSAVPRTDSASLLVRADRERVFAALVDPDALATWLPPGDMTGRFERFDARPGGSYRLVLAYPEGSGGSGKTTSDTDVVEARFVEVDPPHRVRQEVDFVSDEPAFAGTMTMTWELSAASGGTMVEIRAENVPPGISAEDHAAGLRSSLANLAAYVERSPTPPSV